MMESIAIIIGITIIAILGMFLYLKFAKKDVAEGAEKKKEKEQDSKIDLEGMAKMALIILLGISLFTLWEGIVSKDWILVVIICVFYLLLLKVCIFRVESVHVELLESYLVGRFLSKPDKYGCRQPICEPKLEGLRVKLPWWSSRSFKCDSQLLPITLQDYPIKGGTVVLSGLVSARTTMLATFRAAEMTQQESQQRLLARVDQIIRDELIGLLLEPALRMKETLTKIIFEKMNEFVEVTDPLDPTKKVVRKMWGKEVPYAEHHYALEVYEVVINSIVPEETIEKIRNEIQGEKLKTNKLKIYLARDKLIKKIYPTMLDEDRVKVLQIWSEQANRDIKTFEVANASELIKTAIKIFFEEKKQGGEG